jgi:hypothetical protein
LSQIAQGMGIAASRLRACWNRDDRAIRDRRSQAAIPRRRGIGG